MRHKRTIWTDFNTKESMAIYVRDNMRCIYCGDDFALGKAHIFVSRQNGGKGCRQNGVLLCQECHNALDNGKDADKRMSINNYCCDYLHRHYGEINKQELIYNKWR